MDEKGVLFKETLKKIEIPFKLSGIPLHIHEKYNLKRRLFLLWNFLGLNVDHMGALHFFYKDVINGADFVRLTYMAPCILLSSLANAKGLTLALNEREIRGLIKNFIEMEEKAKPYGLDGVYQEDRSTFHKVIVYDNLTNLFMLITFVVAPFSLMVLSYFEGNFMLIYPFDISYPFDRNRLDIYPFVYLHQAWSIVTVLTFISSADYFFYTCCVYISSQFKLLQAQFENLISADQSIHVQIKYTDVQTKFEELVNWHQKLISISNTLEAIYTKSSLHNFVSSSILICLTLFDVTEIKEISFIMAFASFLILSLVQTFLFCYFGDKVTQASADVSGAVYRCLWYLGDPSVVKHLLIVQLRSQKPCKLTALSFADVNQNAFKRIISSAWSYFALLKTLYH